jgi:hypothetical protein
MKTTQLAQLLSWQPVSTVKTSRDLTHVTKNTPVTTAGTKTITN